MDMLGIFLDLETSGLDFHLHRILEVALKIVSLNNGEVIDSYHRIVKQPMAVWERRDLQSMKVNGFTYEKMSTGVDEPQIQEEMIQKFSQYKISRANTVFICQNPSFDRNFLSQVVDVYMQEKHKWPYHWLDLASMYWALEVRKLAQAGKKIPETLSLSKDTIAKAHGLPSEKRPHEAMNGVDHLLDCYKALMASR